MDIVVLSRWQFALTTIYHFFFVPLTLGLGWFVAILETMYVKKGNPMYKRLTKYWGRLFLINYAMGVVTGIVMEFQFGMNWSEYSRFVGDVFGAPLAIEGLLAFFLESTFLGVWIFGWEKISKKLHAAVMWLVAIGGNLSAYWILVANGFMQNPVGYEIVNGRAQMIRIGALLGNPRAILLFLHTFFSGLVTAAFFILGFSIYHLVRNHETEAFKKSFYLSALIGLIATAGVIDIGHLQGIYLRQVQPMAAAASEAHYETADPAAFHLIAGIDQTGRKTTWSITIPKALSMLYFFRPYGEVEGINQIQARYEELYGPGNYIPNVPIAFWTFRVMVGVGFLMAAVMLGALIIALKKFPEKIIKGSGWLVWIILLPYIANTTGWILTETGRQPWVVTGLMQTKDAVSPILTPGTVLISLIGFVLIYGVLMAIDLYLLLKFAKKGLINVEVDSIPIAAVEPTKKHGGK
ncbi:MAG TPA: cytochrome ubiquinol oxidase subunit I [Anaerolineaceae bacterium]|nr:cytochrome ubiquinol oxidase subunit I [Anaerolineaceae bacterium]